MIAETAFGLDLAEWALVGLALIFALDTLGISRSGRTARRQNGDLRERNATLEGEVRTLEEKVSNLERQVDELKSRNVDALFGAFREHDARMTEAARALTENLGRLADGIDAHENAAVDRSQALVDLLHQLVTEVKER